MAYRDHCSCCGARVVDTGCTCPRCYNWIYCGQCGARWCGIHYPDLTHTCSPKDYTVTLTTMPVFVSAYCPGVLVCG